jgi:protein-S-isoprenylcysteine O-methyltransferase Ste14
MSVRLKTIAFLICVPGIVAGAIPLALVWYAPMPLPLGSWRWLGVVLMGTAAIVYVRCSFDLASFGHGMPAPLHPTKFLVRRGLYRHVRNPMYVTGGLFFFGLAVASASGVLFIYAAFVALCYHLAVVLVEEPALRRRFGQSYAHYCGTVPRWLPRLSPADLHENADPVSHAAYEPESTRRPRC